MRSSQEIAQVIELLRKSKGIKQNKMLEDCNLSKNTLANMKTFFPSLETLIKIADYLDCSIDYLLGRTNQINFDTNSSAVNFKEQEVIDIYRHLIPSQQESVLNYLQFLLSQSSNKYIENIVGKTIPTDTISKAARNGKSEYKHDINIDDLINTESKPSEQE